MKPIYKDQNVNYVDAEGKIRLVPIRDILSPTTLHLQLEEGKVNAAGQLVGEHIVLSEYNDDKKTKNTWHYPDEDAPGAAAPGTPKIKPFTPGAQPAPSA